MSARIPTSCFWSNIGLSDLNYYLQQAKKAGITKGEITDVTAKVMAVATGQKKLQFQEVLSRYKVDLNQFE